jgi:hypothetical protein
MPSIKKMSALNNEKCRIKFPRRLRQKLEVPAFESRRWVEHVLFFFSRNVGVRIIVKIGQKVNEY